MTDNNLHAVLADTLTRFGVLVDDQDAQTFEAVTTLGEPAVLGVVSLLCRTYATGAETRHARWGADADRALN